MEYLFSTLVGGDPLHILRDLEAEQVEWSTSKLNRVLSALRGLTIHYATADSQQSLVDDLTSKCITTKQSPAVIESIAKCLAARLENDSNL